MYSQPCGPRPSTTARAPRVADGEAHPGPPHDVEAAAGRAVQAGVAGDRLAARLGRESRLRRDDDDAARQPLRDVVVGLTGEVQLDAGTGEGPERLAGRAVQPEPDRTGELAPLDRAGQARPERAIGRRHGEALGPEPGLAAKGRGQAALERAGVAADDVPTGRRGIGPPSGVTRPTGRRRSRRRDRASPPADPRPGSGATRRRDRRPRAPRPRPSRPGGSRPGPAANRSTCSGVPANFARRSSRWVAIPVGQVSRWHWRAMSQPTATSIAVPKANSSAPRSAAIRRSRPVRRPPSVRRATRSRRPARSSVWWTSARPSSHGAPTCLIELRGDAPGAAAVPRQVDVRRAGLGDAGRDRPDAARGDELHPDPSRRD